MLALSGSGGKRLQSLGHPLNLQLFPLLQAWGRVGLGGTSGVLNTKVSRGGAAEMWGFLEEYGTP